MSFSARITRHPRVFDPDRAAEAPDMGQGPEVAALLTGTAGCSPYLLGLMHKEEEWLADALGDPEAAAARVIADLDRVALPDLGPHLRQAKRRIALIAGLADLGGVWSLEEVTRTLSQFAARAVHAAIVALVRAEIDRGKLPGQTADDAETAGGMVAIAMGKMGADELNYSSDIDLICLFDETRFDPDDYHDARASFVRVTRKMTALLSDNTAEGYVFRTDLRLRPDASVTPVCLSMEAAERYYESVGRTWERAAYIKAAAAAGDLAAGARFLETLRPFVWRKHLDFAAIEDAHDMRLRIRDHKGLGGKLVLDGHNMKLGQGGIREIEFFTQTRQLIAGGRDPDLRVRGTCEGLDQLAAAGWVPQDTATALQEHYRFHRTVEHRLQMVNDAQTHDLPRDRDGFARLAAFMDRDVDALRDDLRARLTAVHTLTEGFFAPDDSGPATTDWGAETVARWQTYPALRSDRAMTIFRRLWPDVQARLKDAARPEEALAQFDGFLAGLPAGVQVLSLFEANPALTQLIVDIAATAPALAQYLSRNAGVLDAVIGGSFFDPWPGVAGLRESLQDALGEVQDYEDALNTTRRWFREWHFRIGVHHLRGLTDAPAVGQEYAELAEAIIATLWPIVCAEFSRKHGPPPGRGAAVLGMGSLGAQQLNALSDLDLIVIYDAAGIEMSDGRRPLATRAYYARLTQALVTALSAPMADGRLYEVDMRLRPSGRQGPVATSWQSFETYQQDEAWTWEHLALTRARVVAGAADLGTEIETFRRALLPQKGQLDRVPGDVAEMRARLASAKPGAGPWDMKAGRGRQQDIELTAQMLALQAGAPARDTAGQIDAGVACDLISAADGAALKDAAALLWRVQAAARLLSGGVLDPDAVGEGGRRLVLRETGMDGMDELRAAIDVATARAAEIIGDLVGPHEGG